jgi:hypothetical protein
MLYRWQRVTIAVGGELRVITRWSRRNSIGRWTIKNYSIEWRGKVRKLERKKDFKNGKRKAKSVCHVNVLIRVDVMEHLGVVKKMVCKTLMEIFQANLSTSL